MRVVEKPRRGEPALTTRCEWDFHEGCNWEPCQCRCHVDCVLGHAPWCDGECVDCPVLVRPGHEQRERERELMADRPIDAPAADTPCEECGEVLGDYWGVTVVKHLETAVGKMLTYAPLHAACWWKRHPDAVQREDERQREVKKDYVLKHEEKKQWSNGATAAGNRRVS